MHQIKQKLAAELSETLDTEVEEEDIEMPEGEYGDFAYPVMKVAGKKGGNPRELAEKTAGELEDIEIVEKVEVAGPGYLNFHLDREKYSEKIEEALESEKTGIEEKEGKMLVEFSSPNLAKPMHIGHLRNNALGDSLQRIMRFVGYDVTAENYLGDWGTQFGKAITSFKHFGDQEELEENPMQHIYELYVKFHGEVEDNPELMEEAMEWSKKIEEGDDEAEEFRKKMREISIEYNAQDYERMDIKFDRITGESKVFEEGKEMIQRGLDKEIFEQDDDGSVYVEFEDGEFPNTVVKRSDGVTLYLTRDIANIEKRIEEGFDYNLYIVGSEQDLHFQQLFKIAEEFGFTDIQNEHISYGMLDLGEESMSSRKGNIITLSDVLEKAVEEAEKRMGDREGDPEAVGIGAVKYANLSVSRQKDISFDWDKVLSFEGDSGPYLQYSNTRAKSIIQKSDTEGKLQGELNKEEYALMKKLAEFPEKVESAAEHREPAKIANYLSQLCEEFNSFYHSCPVLDAEKDDKSRRLKIVELFVEVTDQGLELLGIEPLEKM